MWIRSRWVRRDDALGDSDAGGRIGRREMGALHGLARPMQQRQATEEVMSTQSLNRIVAHEVQVRRQGRIYLMGLVVAAGVVMASLVLAV